MRPSCCSITLRDRINRLEVEINELEQYAKIYASNAEDLAKLTRDAKIAEATYTVLIEQVKSQSLAAGFKPDTFKVFEYATPPLEPSSPNRNFIIFIGATLGFVIGCATAILNSLRRGVYYTESSLILAQAVLALNQDLFPIAKLPLDKLNSQFSEKKVSEIYEADVMLSDKNLNMF